MLDGSHLAGRQLAADGEDDRGGRVFLVAREQGAFGQDQMHAGRFDAGEGVDGAGEPSRRLAISSR